MTALSSSAVVARRHDLTVSYTPEDFRRIAGFLHETTGILLTEANDRMVYARLAARVLDLGLTSFSAYLDQALGPKATSERDHFISALTTNTTHFYRESHHFDFLETQILPGLIERARSGERIRIWSAGCSTGEEPYSIAVCLLQAFPDAPSHDVKILATDLDHAALARATAATYAQNSLRDMAPGLLDIGFDRVNGADQWTPKPQVRSLITFRQLNLIGAWPFQGMFDAIFCRNVAIYMDAETQELIWSGFRDRLQPDSHLFIGHSERLSPSLKSSFTIVGNTIYRRLPASNDVRQPHNRITGA
jgi:chemotaxis protein methyltransferase CheR